MIRKNPDAFLVGLLLASVFLMVIPSVPFAHAFTNSFTEIQIKSCISCGSPLTITDTALNTGDLLAIILTCSTNFQITGITDTVTNNWILATSQSVSISNGWATGGTGTTTTSNQIWYVKAAASTAASTASITTSSAESNCFYTTLDANIAPVQFQSAFTSTSTGASNIVASVSIPAGGIALLMGTTYGQTNSPISYLFAQVAPTQCINCANRNYISNITPNSGSCSWNCDLFYADAQEFSTNGAILTLGLTPPNPLQGANQQNVLVGVVFGATGPPSGITQIQVVACTWYQQQCWFFPTLTISLVAALFIGIGFAGEASARGLTFLALTGLTFGSLMAVVMGMVSYFFPIMGLIFMLIYAVRFKPR